MKTTTAGNTIAKRARCLADEYRDLAEQLAQAADMLDLYGATRDALPVIPVISDSRMVEVMRAGMILRFIAASA